MNKIIRNIGAGVAMCLMMVGCTTNFEEYNTNPYQPGKVPANSLLSTMFKVYASPQPKRLPGYKLYVGLF